MQPPFDPKRTSGTIKPADVNLGTAAQFTEFVQNVLARPSRISIPIDFSAQELPKPDWRKRIAQPVRLCRTSRHLSVADPRAALPNRGIWPWARTFPV